MSKAESKSPFPCIIVYSSEKHVKYIPVLLDLIEECLNDHSLKPVLLGDEIRSGGDYLDKLEELIDSSVLGIVILDGFRPNVLFEFGYLLGKGKPVIVLSSSDAEINVKTLYNNHGLTTNQFNRLRNPKIDLQRHFSDYLRHIPKFERYVSKNDDKHIINVLKKELEKYKREIREEASKMIIHRSRVGERYKQLINALVSSFFEAANLSIVKQIHENLRSLDSYDIKRTIAAAYASVAERTRQH